MAGASGEVKGQFMRRGAKVKGQGPSEGSRPAGSMATPAAPIMHRAPHAAAQSGEGTGVIDRREPHRGSASANRIGG